MDKKENIICHRPLEQYSEKLAVDPPFYAGQCQSAVLLHWHAEAARFRCFADFLLTNGEAGQ